MTGEGRNERAASSSIATHTRFEKDGRREAACDHLTGEARREAGRHQEAKNVLHKQKIRKYRVGTQDLTPEIERN